MRTPDQIAEKSESSIKSQGMIPPWIQEYTDYHADEVGNQLDQLGFVTKQVKGSEVRSDQQDEHTRLRSMTQVAIK